jgi:D-glycero-beta-D-manno-heptose-7-phosphate kinase
MRAGQRLLEGMDAEGVLITRGSEGMALFERGQSPYLLPVAVPTDTRVIDPTGAGDTVAAVFTLAVASNAPMRDAAYLANVAGGVVVQKLGAATVTPKELRDMLPSENTRADDESPLA